MNDFEDTGLERGRHEAAQALLLARLVALAATVGLGLPCLMLGSLAGKFGQMFGEVGAELPAISRLVVGLPAVWGIGPLVLAAATLCFIWAKGRAAAWMAGLGLLLLAAALPMLLFALALPLVRIVGSMGAP